MSVRKVLHVIPSVGPLRGGPSAVIRQMAGSLSQSGVETHVATTNDNGLETLDVPCGAPIKDDDGVTYWYFPRQTRFYTFSWPLSTWLARHVSDFDVVHIHALFSYATLPAAYWAAKRGVPYIVRPLGTLNEWGMANRRPWLKKLSFSLLERRVIEHAARVHYTSEQERVEAEKLRVTARAAIIPNAVAPATGQTSGEAFLRDHPGLRGRSIVLFLSRLDEKKGLDLLLDAFAVVRRSRPDAALVIAGSGDEGLTKRLKAQAEALGLLSDVVWAGFLEGNAKRAALRAASLFVLPSYSENFGNVVVEAMAAGLPVVVSDQVAVHDEVAAADAGLVVPCAVGPLADAMVALLGDSERGHAKGARGRALAAAQYSPAVVTRQLISVYNAILQ